MPGSCWMSQSIIPSNKSYHGITQHVFMVLLRAEKIVTTENPIFGLKIIIWWIQVCTTQGLNQTLHNCSHHVVFLRPDIGFSVVTLFSALNKTIKNMLSETMIRFIAWHYGLGHPATTWYGVQQLVSPNLHSHGGQKWVLLIRPKSYLMRL